MEAQLLRLVGELIGIHADAAAPHQPRPERQEIPLRARRLQHVQRVDPQPAEDQRQLVHQGSVQIPLGVLDHLRRLSHLEARGPVGARRDDRTVEVSTHAAAASLLPLVTLVIVVRRCSRSPGLIRSGL